MFRSLGFTVLAVLAFQGATPSPADDPVETPIEEAVRKGNTEEVKRLLAIDPKSVKMTFGMEDDTLLHWAVSLGHKETAQLLLAKGADPNAQDALGDTPLHDAAYRGHLEIVKMLVAKGASISAGKDRGCTPLHVAVRNGWVEVAAWLIEHGSPFDVENQRGQSELHFANNHPRSAAMVKLLAAKGAKVNQRDRDGYSPLHSSVFNKEAAAALLAAGADPNARDKRGNTRLYAAIVTRQLATVEVLLDNGSRANALITPGRSALDVGAGFPDVAMLLVKHGAASTQPLQEACQQNDLAEVTRLLEKHPAFVNSWLGAGSRTLLHRVAASGNKPLAELLISKGADVDAQDWGKQTPLHVVAEKGRADTAALLIAKGATVDARDLNKRTPLLVAARYNTAEFVQLLLNNGAEVNAESTDGWTPLHAAVRRNQKTSAKHLIDAGADLTARLKIGWKGYTALHLAVHFVDREMVELLLSAGARVNAQNEDGDTPLDLATKRRRKDGLIELLREARAAPEKDGQGNPATE